MNSIGLLLLVAVLLNLYAASLVVLRGLIFRTRVYRPMLFNIVLSLLPALVLAVVLALSVLVIRLPGATVWLWLVIIAGGLAWLLTLPNAAYLITELNMSHRQSGETVPLWYDIVSVLALALSGILNTLLNLLLVQVLYILIAHPNDAQPLARWDSWVLTGVILVLISFGMYLGRYLRLNSWDVKHPAILLRKLGDHLRDGHRAAMVGFCVTHSVLLAIIYLLVMAPAVAQL